MAQLSSCKRGTYWLTLTSIIGYIGDVVHWMHQKAHHDIHDDPCFLLQLAKTSEDDTSYDNGCDHQRLHVSLTQLLELQVCP